MATCNRLLIISPAISPAYAAGVVRHIRDAVRTLPRFPLRGRMVPEFEDPAIRELGVGNYRLIYNPTKDLIYILAIIHGARDLPSLWRREGRQPPLPLEEE